MPHLNKKPLMRNEKKKLGLKLTMNGSGKPFKKFRSIKLKTLQIKMKLSHVNKKPLARELLAFRSTSCFGVTKSTTPN